MRRRPPQDLCPIRLGGSAMIVTGALSDSPKVVIETTSARRNSTKKLAIKALQEGRWPIWGPRQWIGHTISCGERNCCGFWKSVMRKKAAAFASRTAGKLLLGRLSAASNPDANA